jgi:hypothetical protein
MADPATTTDDYPLPPLPTGDVYAGPDVSDALRIFQARQRAQTDPTANAGVLGALVSPASATPANTNVRPPPASQEEADNDAARQLGIVVPNLTPATLGVQPPLPTPPAPPPTQTASVSSPPVTPPGSNAKTLGVQPASLSSPPIRMVAPPDRRGENDDDWATARQKIMQPESGGRNIWNYRHDENPGYFTASGIFQIVDSTWREGGTLAGIDVSQWKHAIEAPPEVQDAVAHALYKKYGYAPWTKKEGGSLNSDGSSGGGGGAGGSSDDYFQRALRMLGGQPYDPSSINPQLERIFRERQEAERPLIENRQRIQQQEEAEAKEEYDRLKHERDLNDPQLRPWTQKPPQPDPIGGLASLGSIFAALASGFSHTPAIAAMNGMAAAIDARNDSNQKQYDDAFAAYKYNAQLALDRNEIQQKAYDAAWARVKENPELGLAELRSVAQIYNDEQTLLTLESGNLENAGKINQARIETAAKLAEQLQKTDQWGMFGPSSKDPLYQHYIDRVRELVAAGHTPEEARTIAGQEWSDAKKRMSSAGTSEADADLIAFDKWKQNHGGQDPTEADKQTPEMAQYRIDARNAAKPKTAAAAKEGDVEILARSAFLEKNGRYPGGNDADQAEMAKLRTSSRQEAAGAITEEEAEFIAGRVIVGERDAATGLARNAVNIQRVNAAIVKIAKEQGLKPGDISHRVAEFNGLMQSERTLGTRFTNMEIPAMEVHYMAPLALEASQLVDRTQYPNLNAIINAYLAGTGDENIVQFGQAAYSLMNTYAKFINPTGIPTDRDKERSTAILSDAWSKGQFKSAVEFMQREIESGRSAVQGVRQELREGAAESSRDNQPPPPLTPVSPGGAASAPGTVPVVDQAGYAALPPGAHFRKQGDPPGSFRVKQ